MRITPRQSTCVGGGEGGVEVVQLAHGVLGEVAAVAVPFIVLLDEDGASKAEKGRGVREHTDDIGAAFDLLVEAFD
jgi:hypothetical protein